MNTREIQQLLDLAFSDVSTASDELMKLRNQFPTDSQLSELIANCNQLKNRINLCRQNLRHQAQQKPSSTRSVRLQILLTTASELRQDGFNLKSLVEELSRND